jgi:hypothetical protein
MTAYLYRANCIAKSVTVGDALAGAIGITPEDASTFSRCGTALFLEGTTLNTSGRFGTHLGTPDARFASPLLTEREYVIGQHLQSRTDFAGRDLLLAKFKSLAGHPEWSDEAALDAIEAGVVLEVGERAAMEAHAQAFITGAGYITQ